MNFLQRLLSPQSKHFTGVSTPAQLGPLTQSQLDQKFKLSSLGFSLDSLSIKTPRPDKDGKTSSLMTKVVANQIHPLTRITKIVITLDSHDLTSLKIYRNCQDNPLDGRPEPLKLVQNDETLEVAELVEEYNFSGEIILQNLVEN